ncbi:MAG: Fe-S cluster assembly protein SufD [Cyclobacteriaceae bacterium]|nr:Fe-S cluster assembly protein SufD [Cyclobacteriaceae bacterium]
MSVTTIKKNITSDISGAIQQTVNSFPLLKEKRNEAWHTFQQLSMPATKNEEYKYTPVTRLLEKNFSFPTANPSGHLSTLQDFSIPELDANIIVFVNGVFSQEHSSIFSNNSEISILTMEDAIVQQTEVCLKHLSAYIDLKADALANWNTAAWTNGVFIHIPAGTTIEKPVVIHHIHDTRNGQVVSIGRNLVVLEKNSAVTIVEKFDSIGDANHFSNCITEAVVAEYAELNLYTIQNDSGKRFQYGLTQIHQADSSRVNTYTFSLNGKLIRNNLQLTLNGEGIESHMYGLYLLTGDTLADNHTVVDHKKPNSFSNELYKGIMDEDSKGVFNGKIFVRPQAQKTNAFQANRNILLTDKATVYTKPQLEIWADDVKCSHGCTSGQLDEEALFYLRSRGIGKETAQAMMLYAFAAELLDNVKHPVIKRYLDNVISERLHKNF